VGGGQIVQLTANGDYAVNYDTAILYYYYGAFFGNGQTSITNSVSVTYKYLVDSTAWRGWGILSQGNTSYNSGVFKGCNFQYLGARASAGNPALYFSNKQSAAQNGNSTDRLASVTYCKFQNCYREAVYDACTGTSADPLLWDHNEHHEARGVVNAAHIGSGK